MPGKKLFKKAPSPPDSVEEVIREEMLFLLEPKEQRFRQRLLGHLLDDGCNWPLVLAQPRFYALMLAGLLPQISAKAHQAFQQRFPQLPQPLTPQTDLTLSHEDFYAMMLFFQGQGKKFYRLMAREVSRSIGDIKAEWWLDPVIFQQPEEEFTVWLRTIVDTLWQAGSAPVPDDLGLIRRRLAMALTTALLRHIEARGEFEAQFQSIPEALAAIQDEHAQFCRLMRFCQERTPYFDYLASRSFWRTLDTLRLDAATTP